LNAALVFLELNGWSVEDPQEELYDAMIGLATGKHTKLSLADVFRRLSRYVND
jgi:prophage maintenance system killer protein